MQVAVHSTRTLEYRLEENVINTEAQTWLLGGGQEVNMERRGRINLMKLIIKEAITECAYIPV